MGLRVGIERSGSGAHEPIQLTCDQRGGQPQCGDKPNCSNTPQLV